MKIEKQEVQRYGRDKDTVINHTYINGGEYRNKFDQISNNKTLNRKVYQIAKKMLNHRSGTEYEDMYWLDIDSMKIIAFEINQRVKRRIQYSKSTEKAISTYENILVIHTHPNSMPPSSADFNSALKNKYQICVVCCHDGKIFLYQSRRYIVELAFKLTVAKYKKMGYDEYESQMKALKEYEQKSDILVREV